MNASRHSSQRETSDFAHLYDTMSLRRCTSYWLAASLILAIMATPVMSDIPRTAFSPEGCLSEECSVGGRASDESDEIGLLSVGKTETQAAVKRHSADVGSRVPTHLPDLPPAHAAPFSTAETDISTSCETGQMNCGDGYNQCCIGPYHFCPHGRLNTCTKGWCCTRVEKGGGLSPWGAAGGRCEPC